MNVDRAFREGLVAQFAVHRAVRLHMNREFAVFPHYHRIVRKAPTVPFVKRDERFAAKENGERVPERGRFGERDVEEARRKAAFAKFRRDRNALDSGDRVPPIPAGRDGALDDGDVPDDAKRSVVGRRNGRENGAHRTGVVPSAARSENIRPIRERFDKKTPNFAIPRRVDLRFVERLNRCGFGHWGAFVAEDD